MTLFAQVLHTPRFHAHWRALLAVMVVVVSWFAFAPHPPGLEFDNADKLQHVLAFAALACVASFAQMPGRRAAQRTAAGLLAYGLLIEGVQAFLPTRSADWADVVGDCVGIAAGLLVALLLRSLLQHLLHRRRPP